MLYNRGKKFSDSYKCEVCGCSLDPGEGSVCDDCKAETLSMEYVIDNVNTLLKDVYKWSDESCDALKKKIFNFIPTSDGSCMNVIEYFYNKIYYHIVDGVSLAVDDVDELFKII